MQQIFPQTRDLFGNHRILKTIQNSSSLCEKKFKNAFPRYRAVTLALLFIRRFGPSFGPGSELHPDRCCCGISQMRPALLNRSCVVEIYPIWLQLAIFSTTGTRSCSAACSGCCRSCCLLCPWQLRWLPNEFAAVRYCTFTPYSSKSKSRPRLPKFLISRDLECRIEKLFSAKKESQNEENSNCILAVPNCRISLDQECRI
jgi:hypothetical protein